MKSTAFVIAHYDPDGKLAAYLLEFVQHLRSLTSRVVFVSTNIRPDGVAALNPYAQVIARENVGYDFWSYKLGIAALGDLSKLDRLVILNSSFLILEPRRLCDRFFAASGNADLLGLTHCHEFATHLQSYWICFDNNKVINSEAFAHWWDRMEPISERQQVIERYEVGMSTYFAGRGFRLASVFRQDRLQKFVTLCRAIGNGALQVQLVSDGDIRLDPEMGDRFNPSAYNWDALLPMFGIVKLELLKRNPMGINIHQLVQALLSDPRSMRLYKDALGIVDGPS